ncbi:CBS domain-containing protein [Streptomyces bobili]|uniref:CBS domain-containing protein n=1 Tax=Streptomyces bobili TaxID=67280 RepID=UPI0037215004
MNRAPKAGAWPIPNGIPVCDAMLRDPKVLGPATTVAQVRAFFDNDYVHAALLVDRGRLLSVVEPADLIGSRLSSRAVTVGRLPGRVIQPDADLATTWEAMTAHALRRLAVMDSRGVFFGLLCPKRSGRGCCTDTDVRTRKHERSTVG